MEKRGGDVTCPACAGYPCPVCGGDLVLLESRRTEGLPAVLVYGCIRCASAYEFVISSGVGPDATLDIKIRDKRDKEDR